MVPPLGRAPTTTSDRITAGPGTSAGASSSFSRDVAAHAATNSTNRDTKQWDTSSLSLTTNPDLARLTRLWASLRADGSVTDQTPIYAIGMSRGAGFASVFAQAFENAGSHVAAIAPSHGQIPASVRLSGGLTVPAFFTLGANGSAPA